MLAQHGGLKYNPILSINIGDLFMSDIIKNCKVHGPLTREHVAIHPRSNRPNGAGEIRCLECKAAKAKRAYEKRRDIELAALTPEQRRAKRDEINTFIREDRAKDPEKYRKWERKFRNKNIERARISDIILKYKLTREEYESMILAQDNKCYRCNKPETRKSRTPGQICSLIVDHCHKTGKVRKLLCHSCNVKLGKIKDSKELARIKMQGEEAASFIKYLEEHPT